MKMKYAFVLFIVAFTATIATAQQKQSVELVAPLQFETKMKSEKGQIVDVRTPGEYKAGHLSGALNLHIYDKDFVQRLEKLDKKKPVYVYCKAGGRSSEAVDIMKTKGFIKIIELKGGIDAWLDAGKPVIK